MIEQNTGSAATAPAEPPRRRADELLATIAERLGARFGATSVFGAPVERDGVTVIPVATVRFGLGGGTGSEPEKGEGEGAGCGGSMAAAGYIELKGGRSRFVAIVRPERMVALVFLSAVAALAVALRATADRKPRRRLPFNR